MARATTACMLATLAAAAPVSAQVSTVGTVDLMTTFIRGVDGAPDPSGAGLIVSGQDKIIAHCVNADGVAGGAITVKAASGSKPFGAFPRARYSPATGLFLVVWPEEQPDPRIVLKARTVSCPSGALGAAQIIGQSAWLESGAAIEWSATSGKYLVVWKAFPSTLILAQLVNPDGTPYGAPVTLSVGFGRDPGVAWNPARDEFGVSFSGETSTGVYSAFVIVPAADLTAFRRSTFNVLSGGLTTITDLIFNPDTQRYVMTWFELSSGSFTKIAEFDAAGRLASQGVASTRLGSYDALSLAYSRTSGTFLLAGLDRVTDQLLVAELNAHGFRFAPEQMVTTNLQPVRYPRVAGAEQRPRWFVPFAKGNGGSGQYQGTAVTFLQTVTSGGGPPGDYGNGAPPPPPPPSGFRIVRGGE